MGKVPDNVQPREDQPPEYAAESTRSPWARYLNGRWVLAETPKRPGIYACRARYGAGLFYRKWADRGGRLVDTCVPTGDPGWQGWRWSEPLPPPPKPLPEIDE